MTLDKLNAETQKQIDACLRVLAEKGKEYALGADRLEHFKIAAAEQDATSKQALWGMLSKHLASLNAMCKNESDDIQRWNEKITDSINYLLLLWGLVLEDFDV